MRDQAQTDVELTPFGRTFVDETLERQFIESVWPDFQRLLSISLALSSVAIALRIALDPYLTGVNGFYYFSSLIRVSIVVCVALLLWATRREVDNKLFRNLLYVLPVLLVLHNVIEIEAGLTSWPEFQSAIVVELLIFVMFLSHYCRQVVFTITIIGVASLIHGALLGDLFTSPNSVAILVATCMMTILLLRRWNGSERLRYIDHQRYKKARLEAEAASQAKSNFMAVMSHEIRTPLNGIQGMTSILSRENLSESQAENVKIIEESSSQLLILLNDILDFTKIEAGQLTLENIPFDISSITMFMDQIWRRQLKDKGIDFQVDLEACKHKYIYGDPTRMRQVLNNLLSNAFKFTQEGSVRVVVSTEQRSADSVMVKCSVIDTGIGVAKKDQGKLFQRFSQADDSITRKFGGTGLGLVICRQLAEAMGGQAGMESAGRGGSTFWFTMDAELAGADAVKEILENANADDATAAKPKVLVVDDNPVNVRVLVSMLEVRHYDCESANSGAEAIEAVSGGDYDIVLMDVQMPEMSGIEAMQAIRQKGDIYEDLPIIAVTANAMIGDRETYLLEGMTDYISKPIQTTELYSVVERCLKNRAQEKCDGFDKAANA